MLHVGEAGEIDYIKNEVSSSGEPAHFQPNRSNKNQKRVAVHLQEVLQFSDMMEETSAGARRQAAGHSPDVCEQNVRAG